MKRFLVNLGLLSTLALGGCTKTGGGNTKPPTSRDLKGGGVYVVYNHGCDQGCDQIKKGDLIQSVDGVAVTTAAEIDKANITDGNTHKLVVLGTDGAEKAESI